MSQEIDIAALRKAALHNRGLTSYTSLALLDRLAHLERVEAAWREWNDKTDFVQEWINAGKLPPKYLGKHRADILRDLADRLEQAERERDELRAGLPTIRIRVDATEALAGIEGVQEIVRDAARLEWLCLDLPTGPERAKQFEVIERLPMMSLSAAREAISAAMQGEGA